jgi:hypothetical protein
MFDLLYLEYISVKLSGFFCVFGIEPDSGQFAFSIEHVQIFGRLVQKMLSLPVNDIYEFSLVKGSRGRKRLVEVFTKKEHPRPEYSCE